MGHRLTHRRVTKWSYGGRTYADLDFNHCVEWVGERSNDHGSIGQDDAQIELYGLLTERT